MLEVDKFKPNLKSLCEKLESIRDEKLSSDRYLRLVVLKNEKVCQPLIFSASTLGDLTIKLGLDHLRDLMQEAEETVSKGQEKQAKDLNPRIEKILSLIMIN